MKPKVVLLSLLFLFLCYLCSYDEITHMSKDDMAWFDCYDINDSVFFKSNKSDVDTLYVTNIQIFNSLNPINDNPNATSEYIAIGYIDFSIMHDGQELSGMFECKKITQDSLKISIVLDERFANNLMPKNIIRVSDENSSLSICNDQDNPIMGLGWSKSEGLLSYIFKDGMVYRKQK